MKKVRCCNLCGKFAPADSDWTVTCWKCRADRLIGTAAVANAKSILYSLDCAGWGCAKKAKAELIAAGLKMEDDHG